MVGYEIKKPGKINWIIASKHLQSGWQRSVHSPLQIFDRTSFMHTCFKKVGSLPRARIAKLRKVHHNPIKSDLDAQAAARLERQRRQRG